MVARSALSLRSSCAVRDSVPRIVLDLLLEVVAEPLVLLEHLLAEFALPLGMLLVDRGRLALERARRFLQFDGQAAVRVGPVVPLGLDLAFERLGFTADVRLQRIEPLAHVVLEAGGLLDEPFLEPGEAPLDVAHLVAEQNVANLVETRRGGSAGLDLDRSSGQGGIAHGQGPRLTPDVPHEHRTGDAAGTVTIMG